MASMITATAWVPRGHAAAYPTKYEFDEEEYERISKLAKMELEDAQEGLEEAKKALTDAGLTAPSGHWSLDVLEKEVERIMEEAQLLEVQYVVVPFLAEARRKDAAAWKAVAKSLDEIGSYFHGVGIELGEKGRAAADFG